MMASFYPPRSADAQTFVLSREVNSVILENLTALVGSRNGALLKATVALLDTLDRTDDDTADGAIDAPIAITVK